MGHNHANITDINNYHEFDQTTDHHGVRERELFVDNLLRICGLILMVVVVVCAKNVVYLQ